MKYTLKTPRIIFLILFSISYLFIIFSKTGFIQKIYLTAFCYLIFSHTVHPWYLALLVLMLPLYFNYTVFYWSGIISLTNITVYYYLKNNEWSDFMPVLIIEYVILLILLYKDVKNYQKNSFEISRLYFHLYHQLPKHHNLLPGRQAAASRQPEIQVPSV